MGESLVSQPGLSVRLEDLLSNLVGNNFSLDVLVNNLLEAGILSNSGVSLGVKLFEVLDLGGLESLIPLGELFVIDILGVLL